MTNYLIRRSLQMLVVLLFASALIFFILELAPGGPFDALRQSKRSLSPDYVNNLNAMVGLDKPIYVQYWDWLTRLLRGDWGRSWVIATGMDVGDLMWSRLGNTVLLMSSALVISLAIALPIGIYSAIRQYSVADYVVTSGSFFGISMPTFWLGLLAIIVFAVKLNLFPAGGISTPGLEGSLPDKLYHMVLPAFVLSVVSVAGWSRYLRSSMLEVLRQDYVRTARAKGLRERVVIGKHALRNALIPVITVVALDLPNLFAGAIVTETVFAWPGMGRLYWSAVTASDWPVAMGVLVITTLLVVFSNLLADVCYALVDPRIRYD